MCRIFGTFLSGVLLLSVTLAHAELGSSFDVPDYKDVKTKDIMNWTPSKEMERDYSYYLSGFDDEDSPIWVAEMGRWKNAVGSGPELERDFKLYLLQFLKRAEQSVKLRSTPENPVTEFSLIIDMDGYKARDSTTPRGIAMSLWMARQFGQAFGKNVKIAYILNGGFAFATIWNLMKPVLGTYVYKVDIFGSNKERWIPILLRRFPKDQLPPWYGGYNDYKPVQVYG